MRTVSGEIGYAEYGSSEGTPVLLLHGFPDDANTWKGVSRELLLNDLRLLAPSQRGFGTTRIAHELLSGETAALGLDVLEFADALGLERFFVVGHDWGARAGYAAAALSPHRISGLLALATPYVIEKDNGMSIPQARAYWYQWCLNTQDGRDIFERDVPEFCRYLWQTWSPEWNFSSQDFEDATAAWRNPQFLAVVTHAYRHRHGDTVGNPHYTKQQSFLDRTPSIPVPTIFACGLSDACNLPESSQAQQEWFTNGYHRVELEGVGHFPQRENPAAIASLIRHLVNGDSEFSDTGLGQLVTQTGALL